MKKAVLRLSFLAVLAVGGTVVWWIVSGGFEVNPLPLTDDIEGIEYRDPATKERAKFTVPREHWDKIFATLQPARRDNFPAKWVIIGELQIACKGGRSFHVSLFDLRDGRPGAFAAGETHEKRVYYRGGDSVRLKEALRAAGINSRSILPNSDFRPDSN